MPLDVVQPVGVGSVGPAIRWPPMIRFRPSGVSWAMTRPWSMTLISSASASASSRYCVVSRTVEPSVDQAADDVPHVLALGRVETGGRLVEEDHRGTADQAGREVEPPAHAAASRSWPSGSAASAEVEPLEQFGGARLGVAAAEVQQLADEHEVLGAGEVLVDRGVLAGQADGAADLVRLGGDVVPADQGGAGVGLQQGGENADRGGLAGAVRAEDAEDGAFAGGEVDPVEGLGGAEALPEPLGLDHEVW